MKRAMVQPIPVISPPAVMYLFFSTMPVIVAANPSSTAVRYPQNSGLMNANAVASSVANIPYTIHI